MARETSLHLSASDMNPSQPPAVAVEEAPNDREPGFSRFGDVEAFDPRDDVESLTIERNRIARFDSCSLVVNAEAPVARAQPPTTPSSDLRGLSPGELFASRLNHVSRRLEELHQCEVKRFTEERRETWILVFALSVVLIFCFAAFFMNQIEVRDLRTGLEEALDRRASQTVSSIEGTLAGLHLERIPKLRASLEKLIVENDRASRGELERLFEDLKSRDTTKESKMRERLAEVESQLEHLLRVTNEIRDEAVGEASTGNVAGDTKAIGDPRASNTRSSELPAALPEG